VGKRPAVSRTDRLPRGVVFAVIVSLTMTTALIVRGSDAVVSTEASRGDPPSAHLEPVEVQPFPPQAAALVYGDPAEATAFAHPGGLVVAGRDNYQAAEFRNVAAAGGTVLIYLDAVIDNPHGRYHELLVRKSSCGPATTRWPGSYRANSWGYLNDFREGSVLQSKIECVLETMVRENPHMGGWFVDDLGSRSWFPDIDWDKFPDKGGYRAGAIAITQTLRRVADRHHLIFVVNGTWAGGSPTTAGGGYPNPKKSGNALADGGVVEHHDDEISYFGPYACSSQWAEDSSVTHGEAVNYAVTSTPLGTTEYIRSSCFAFVNDQADYAVSDPWGISHPTGLPTNAH
jgi:hypothetical protein